MSNSSIRVGDKKAMWGGRFEGERDDVMRRFSESVSFDARLYQHDIRGSVAHAKMLVKIGVLSRGEFRSIERGLKEIQKQIEEGGFVWQDALEDVHMNIEATLTQKVSAGAKLHTGRSRNDQVATDMRLWMKDEVDADLAALRRLQWVLVELADRYSDSVLPGYTHLQRAQPVTVAHHLLAYVEMLERDCGRLVDARKRADLLPLGSGALAGSTLPLDRKMVAKELGFSGVTQNSLDAVSDRDFVVEYCSAAALGMVHLSRLAEDLIVWSSSEFGFIEIGDAFTTGSSLMPQKKNPDAAELVRGKSGRVVGNLMSLLTMLKGLPMTYNRDLQEDKERLFDTADTYLISLRVMAGMLETTEFREDVCRVAAGDPLLLATDVADALVKRGIAFRQAHEIVGKGVALAERTKRPLDLISLREWKEFDERIEDEDLLVFNLRRSLRERKMEGAPSPSGIRKQLNFWKKQLASVSGKGSATKKRSVKRVSKVKKAAKKQAVKKVASPRKKVVAEVKQKPEVAAVTRKVTRKKKAKSAAKQTIKALMGG